MNNLLDNVYGTLFNPDETFDQLKENPSLLQASLLILLITAVKPILELIGSKSEMSFLLSIFGVLFSIAGIVICWLFVSYFLDIFVGIFKESKKIRIFLTLSAFSLLPLIFLNPINLLKSAGTAGYIVALILGILIFVWFVKLLNLALIKTYDLTSQKSLLLLSLPFLGLIFSIGSYTWLIYILYTIFYY